MNLAVLQRGLSSKELVKVSRRHSNQKGNPSINAIGGSQNPKFLPEKKI
jgi:hypothetical protein